MSLRVEEGLEAIESLMDPSEPLTEIFPESIELEIQRPEQLANSLQFREDPCGNCVHMPQCLCGAGPDRVAEIFRRFHHWIT